MSKEKLTSKCWMITLWNPLEAERLKTKCHLVDYMCVGEELCPHTMRCHYHLYIEFCKQYTISSVKSILKSKEIHCEIARLGREQCVSYCLKDGKCFFQYERPSRELTPEICEDIFDVFNIKLNHKVKP